MKKSGLPAPVARVFGLCLAFLVIAGLPLSAGAQSTQLTPQQQALLNQLPPAQRQEALRLLAQMQREESQAAPRDSLSEDTLSPQTTTDGMLNEAIRAASPPKASINSTVIVRLTPRDELSALDVRRLRADPALAGVEGSHHYEIDAQGNLVLPGLGSVRLLGLTESQIQERLSAEPTLRDFQVEVTLLDAPTQALPVRFRPTTFSGPATTCAFSCSATSTRFTNSRFPATAS